jgi:hypothetical protein
MGMPDDANRDARRSGTRPIDSPVARLVNLADVSRELSEVTDRAVILADACRAHQDQAKQLIDIGS